MRFFLVAFGGSLLHFSFSRYSSPDGPARFARDVSLRSDALPQHLPHAPPFSEFSFRTTTRPPPRNQYVSFSPYFFLLTFFVGSSEGDFRESLSNVPQTAQISRIR